MNPTPEKPLIDKLNVKPEHRACVLGIDSPELHAALVSRGVRVSKRQLGDTDLIFWNAAARRDLVQIAQLIRYLKQDGALWVVYPKGVKVITEANVREAGLAAGLVDNKIVRFSATHTGLRFVIPSHVGCDYVGNSEANSVSNPAWPFRTRRAAYTPRST